MPPTRKRRSECPIERGIVVIAGRWKARIVWLLFAEPLRYRDLEARIPGIGQRALSIALAELAADGVTLREGEVWSVTPRGRALQSPLAALYDWGSAV